MQLQVGSGARLSRSQAPSGKEEPGLDGYKARGPGAQEGVWECHCVSVPGRDACLPEPEPLPKLPLHSAGPCDGPQFESYPLTSCVTLGQLLNLSVSPCPRLSHGVAIMVKSENTCEVLSTEPGMKQLLKK